MHLRYFDFYFLSSRIWELFVGSILVFIEKKDIFKNKFSNLYPLIGFILITFSIFYYDHETFHPSFLTIVPVLGTCLIILYANKNEIITKILSLRSLVGIGLISYSYIYGITNICI